MSNTLEKLFVAEYTLIPGYTIRRWHPPVSVTTTTYYTTTALDQTLRALAIPEGASGVSYALGANVIVRYTDKGVVIYEVRTVTHSEDTTTIIPGYFTYDVQPDTYSVSYNPNIGWNSSARSIPSIIGDGTASFTVRVDEVGAVVGLNEMYDSSGSDYFEITYGLYFTRGTYRVVEQGIVKTGSLTYVADDVFTVSRADNDVFYAINNVVFYKSTLPSTTELLLDCSLYAGGDAIYDATLVDGSIVEERSASLTASTALELTPKAQAVINAEATLLFNGVYLKGDDVYAASNALTGTATLLVIKNFAAATLTATATVTATGHHVTELRGVFGQMTASATSGYYAYAEINGGLPSMTAHAGVSELSNDFTYMASALEGLTANIISLVGQTNQPSEMAMPSLTAFGTARTGDYVYAAAVALSSTATLDVKKAFAESTIQADSSAAFSGTYTIGSDVYASQVALSAEAALNVVKAVASADMAATASLSLTGTYSFGGALYGYAALTGTMQPMQAFAMQLPDSGNFASIPFVQFTASGSGHAVATNSLEAPFVTFSAASLGGGNAAFSLATLSASGTGSHADTGSADIAFDTFTLSSTGTVFGNGAATIGFIRSTITSRGGGFGAFSTPAFTASGTGSHIPGGTATIPFVEWSAQGSGAGHQQGTGSVDFASFNVDALSGGQAQVSFLTWTSDSSGSKIDTGSAEIQFVKFTTSGLGRFLDSGQGAIGFISSTITGHGGGFGAFSTPTFTAAGTGSPTQNGTAALAFLSWSVASTGTIADSGTATIGLPVFTSIWGSAALPFADFAVTATGSQTVANAVAYVMNINTTESWKYTNQDFLHIIAIGGKFYGVKANGLYLLEGSTDNGTAINSVIKTKSTDFGSFKSKRVKYFYLNSDTATTVRPIVDEVSQNSHTSSFGGRKCVLALGNQGRYWQFEVSGINKLEGIEVLPIETQRRVK